MMVGLVVGSVTYHVNEAGGQVQYAVAGAATGAVVMVAVLLLRGTSLASATVALPLGDVTFVVPQDKRNLAWQIFHEAASRIVMRPLPEGHGSVRKALKSMHTWVTFSRELLRPQGPAANGKPGQNTVEYLWYDMINGPVSRFLSYWDIELEEFEKTGAAEREWPRNAECRYELRRLQRDLRPYMTGLAELAGVAPSEVDRFLGPEPALLPHPNPAPPVTPPGPRTPDDPAPSAAGS